MRLFSSAFRYALALAMGLGLMHFGGALARAEPCGGSEAGGFSSSASFAGATPVAVGTIPDKKIAAGASFVRFSARFWFTETSGSALAYSAASSHPGVARVGDACGSMIKINAAGAGTAKITVTATANGGSATQEFSVAVDPKAVFPVGPSNSAPAAQRMIADRTFTKKTSPLRFVVSSYFSDSDGDALTYAASASSTTVVRASVADSTLTLVAVSKDSTRVTVTATDPDGLAARQFFVATVANSPPEAKGAMPARSLTLGVTPTLRFGASSYFADADSDRLTYRLALSSSGVATASVAGSTLTLRAVSAGRVTITVTASDGAASVGQRFVATVRARPNQGPVTVKDIPGRKFTVGDAAATFNLNDYFSDPEGAALAYVARSNRRGVAAASVTGSTLSITPKAAGSAAITLTATDPGGLSAAQHVAVEVSAAPKPPPPPAEPLSAAITGPTKIVSGTSHTWRSTVTGGRPSYSYSWYVATRCANLDHLRARDEPCALQWSGAGSGASLTRAITTTGAYAHIRLVVSDSDSPGSSAEDRHSVEVKQPNNAPLANGSVASRTLTLGSSATRLNVSSWFTDKDGDRLTYTVASSPSGVVGASIPSSGVALTLSSVKAGAATVTVTARDPSGASARQSFGVRVNRRPVASKAIPAQAATVGGASATLDLSGYFSDADGDRLTWRVNRSNGRVTTSVSGNTLTIRPVSSGATTLTVIATDPHGASASQSVTVNVATAAGLSASISGPSRVSSEVRNTWTASASGGRSPYVYRWRYTRRCSGPADNLEADSAREVCTEWGGGGVGEQFFAHAGARYDHRVDGDGREQRFGHGDAGG